VRAATRHLDGVTVYIGLARIHPISADNQRGSQRGSQSNSLLRLAAALICLLGLNQAAGAADGGCIRLDKDVSGVHVIPGRFASGKAQITYCLYARAGQRVRINVKPSGRLNLEANVRFAGVPASDWAPGSPGGVVLDEALPWTGKYLLVIGQRFGERRKGAFEVDISTH
jgi:hypothetical protein